MPRTKTWPRLPRHLFRGTRSDVLALNSWYQVTAGAWLASHRGIKDRDLVVGLNGYSSAPRDSPARRGELLRTSRIICPYKSSVQGPVLAHRQKTDGWCPQTTRSVRLESRVNFPLSSTHGARPPRDACLKLAASTKQSPSQMHASRLHRGMAPRAGQVRVCVSRLGI